MKYAVAGIACLVLVALGSAQVAASGTAVVEVDSLNVRTGAGTHYGVAARLSRGDEITVSSYSNGWFKVSTPQAETAFVSSEFVRLSNVEGVVNDYGVNIRSGASLNADIIARSQGGMRVEISGTAGDFYRITHNGRPAFIHTDFVTANAMTEMLEVTEGQASAVPGTVTDNNVNIRAAASTNSAVLGRLSTGAAVTVHGVSGAFYRIAHNNGFAYIHSDFVSGPQLSGAAVLSQPVSAGAYTHVVVKVTAGTTLNMRQQPTFESGVAARFARDTAVQLLEAGETWHRVSHNGQTGYVSAEFVELRTGTMPDTSLRGRIVEYSRRYLGLRYVWGGTNLNTGVDCSGFTQSVFRNFGININRVSRDQINNGTRVNRSQLRPGDLVFFSNDRPGVIQHVGIYIGGGQFIHSASGRAMSVIISGLDDAWYRPRFIGGANVIG